MNKFIIICILIFSLLFLSSCSAGGSRTEMLNKDNDEKKAENVLTHVIDAIKNQDIDALKKIFSKQAVGDADDFDDEVDSLFRFIQGKINSFEKTSGPTVFESNDHGRKKKEVSSYYYVKTDSQKYFFLLKNYPVDTENPDNVGLYMLLVVKAEDKNDIYDGDKKILYDGDKKISHAGIYIPIK
jgi:hypothetical protein